MPSSSKAQHNFMAAIANSPAFAKKAGVPMSVGKDFTAADKALKLPTSTRNRADLQTVNNPKTNQGRNELFSKGGDTMATKMNPGFMAMMAKKKSMSPMGMKREGMANFETSGKDVEKKGMKEGSKADMAMDKRQMMGMNHGGMHKMPDGKMMKDSAMKKMASGGFTRAADGVASKGKTKGTQIRMNKGGRAC